AGSFSVVHVGEAGAAEVGLGPEAEPGGAAVAVDLEDHALPLAEHAEDRAREGVGRQLVLGPVGVAHEHALSGTRVVRLDHTLQGEAFPPRLRSDRGTYRRVSL